MLEDIRGIPRGPGAPPSVRPEPIKFSIFFFFLLIAQIRISSAILNRRDANRHPRLIPDHRGKPSLIMKSEVCCGVFIESNVIYQLRKLPPIPGSLRVFNQEREWDFIKCLLCIYHGHHTLEEEMATHSTILA